MRIPRRRIARLSFLAFAALLGFALWTGRATLSLQGRAIGPRLGHGPLPDGLYRVSRVMDGDTITVSTPDGEAKVRVLGINTPETVDPRKTVECFGKEASARAHGLLDGTTVGLETGPGQDDVDKYGRNLRYVRLADGSDYGLGTVRDGYAYEYTYRSAYARQASYRRAQAEAKAQKRGLWADDTCRGLKHP